MLWRPGGMLRVVALLAVLLVVACGNSPGPSSTPSPSAFASPSPAASVGGPSVEPSAATSPSGSPTPVSSAALRPDSLVVVSTRGGECPTGACGSVTVIDRTGRVHTLAPDVAELGTVRPDIMAGLELALDQADFAVIRSVPFTGECPVNVDGQEQVYEFVTPGGVERVASCETEIDAEHPLFLAVEAALANLPR